LEEKPVKNIASIAVQVTVWLMLFVCVASAQSAGASSRKTPSLTMDDLGKAASNQSGQGQAAQDYLALLPPSDVVLMVDAQVALRLLGGVNLMSSGDLRRLNASAELMQKLGEFMDKTGIDLRKISYVTGGFSLSRNSSGFNSGVLIVEGGQPDLEKLAAVLQKEKNALRKLTYQGRTLLTGSKNDEGAVALLDGGFIFGDQESVKSVLDAQAGVRPGFANALHRELLSEVSSSALMRFSAVLPDSLRESLVKNKTLASLSTISMLAGSVTLDSGVMIDLRARTSAPEEAAEASKTLNGLITLGRTLFGSDQKPESQLINQVLGEARINTQRNDITLSLHLPQSLIEQFRTLSSPSKRNVAEK
jgi:hypothetical protein